MESSPGWAFDPAERDREHIEAFDAPLFVIAPPGAPAVLGWSWEVQDGVPVFGEVAYAGPEGRQTRVRTWRTLPAGRHAAISAHRTDLVHNVAAGATELGVFEPIELVIDGMPREGQAAGLGRFRFVVCEVGAVLVTMATPAEQRMPALVSLQR